MTLGDMSPSPLCSDQADSRSTDLELVGDNRMRKAGLYQANDFYDLRLCKFRHGVLLAENRAALRLAIDHVNLLCSKKQMVRVDAGRGIAPMKNPNLMGQLAEMDLPRNSMGEHVFPGASSNVTVSFVVTATVPQPASIRFVHEGPEALLDSTDTLHPASGFCIAMAPKANSMRIAKAGVAAYRLAAIGNRAYGLFSHLGLHRRLTWSGLEQVLTHRFGPLSIAEKSYAYNYGRV